jgi:PncC family amidohydrolase
MDMQDDTQLLEAAILQRSEQLVTALKQRGLTMTTVESCTGGMIAAAVTSVAGSSAVFHQGYVTYCDAAKHALVGVRSRTLRRYTAVSAQTASEMAKGGARRAKADLCISVTGYAGPPSGDPDEEVGLVYIGCRFGRVTKVREFHFSGDRGEVRLAACAAALGMALRALEK